MFILINSSLTAYYTLTGGISQSKEPYTCITEDMCFTSVSVRVCIILQVISDFSVNSTNQCLQSAVWRSFSGTFYHSPHFNSSRFPHLSLSTTLPIFKTASNPSRRSRESKLSEQASERKKPWRAKGKLRKTREFPCRPVHCLQSWLTEKGLPAVRMLFNSRDLLQLTFPLPALYNPRTPSNRLTEVINNHTSCLCMAF